MIASKTARRKTIGVSPLDALLSDAPAATASTEAPQLATRQSKKVRATFHIPTDLFEEARDAVVALSGPPARLTLAELAETALRREIERLKKAHNEGNPFPRREADLRGGRPIGS
jgi:hypothetical protein